MNHSIFATISMLILAGAHHVSAADPTPAKPRAELQKDFLDLKFGMFLHYNMATYTGEEWVVGYPDPKSWDGRRAPPGSTRHQAQVVNQFSFKTILAALPLIGAIGFTTDFSVLAA